MICIELDHARGTTCQMMIYDSMTARGVVDESIFCVMVCYTMRSLSRSGVAGVLLCVKMAAG